MTRGLLVAGLALIGGLVVGCSAEDNGPPPPKAPTQSEQDAAIAEIQNNPNMNQQSKDQAIAGYKAGMARFGQAGAGAAGTPPK